MTNLDHQLSQLEQDLYKSLFEVEGHFYTEPGGDGLTPGQAEGRAYLKDPILYKAHKAGLSAARINWISSRASFDSITKIAAERGHSYRVRFLLINRDAQPGGYDLTLGKGDLSLEEQSQISYELIQVCKIGLLLHCYWHQSIEFEEALDVFMDALNEGKFRD